jgi:hypothetical protein
MRDSQMTYVPIEQPVLEVSTTVDPWVSDLNGSFQSDDCQSTVGFDSHPCDSTPLYYVELNVVLTGLANPRWEGKLCNPCLVGWFEWATEVPEGVQVVSVNPIVSDS